MKNFGGLEGIPSPSRPIFEDFTVTAVGPLRIQRDGDASELAFTPDSLVDPLLLLVGDRVRVELASGRLIVHGRQDGLPVQFPYTNLCINGTGRTNQRAYVSGTYVNPGVYMLDRWKAGSVVENRNYVSNPSAETATTGWTAVPGTSGVAALTSAAPSTSTAFGTKVLKQTWSVASTAASGAGVYYDINIAAAGIAVGDVISMALYHVKSSINNRLRTKVEFRTVGDVFISAVNGTEFQVTAGTIYTATSTAALKQENITVPATTAVIRVYLSSVSGTGYANWSIASYLEVDGAIVNAGATALTYFDGATADTSTWDYGWVGTANASVSTRTPTTAITFVSAPQGQTMTVSAGGSAVQVIERANIRIGDHVLSWPGTSQGRVYKSGTTAPAYAASPVVATLDGTGDVILEFNAGTMSVGDEGVKFEFGDTATPFSLEPAGVELARCQRYGYTPGGVDPWPAFYQSTTTVYATLPLPVTMRASPTATFVNGTSFWRMISSAGTDNFDTMAMGYSGRNSVTLVGTGNVSGTAGNPGVVTGLSGGTVFLESEL